MFAKPLKFCTIADEQARLEVWVMVMRLPQPHNLEVTCRSIAWTHVLCMQS